ncbi:MAG TPA: Uma2 family endonuclease, partial [Mycobacterium sp.]
MSVATVHPQPWTVDELYALPEDGMRHELLDGTLLVSPPPSVSHQLGAARLRSLLAAAAPAEVEVLEAVGVAVPAGLLVPDVVVARASAVYAGPRQLQAGDVLAVAEIVSASSKTADRRWKPEAYAEAGIAVYVRVELDAPPARKWSTMSWSGMPTGWRWWSAAT